MTFIRYFEQRPMTMFWIEGFNPGDCSTWRIAQEMLSLAQMMVHFELGGGI